MPCGQAWRAACTATTVPVWLALALHGWARTGPWQVGGPFDYQVRGLVGGGWYFRLGTTTPSNTKVMITTPVTRGRQASVRRVEVDGAIGAQLPQLVLTGNGPDGARTGPHHQRV